MPLQPVCLLNVVGLTQRHLGEYTPCLTALASNGLAAPLIGVTPAVTCSAQATMLTGVPPADHGIVGNGWFWRETGEVRFWLQSNRLIEAETIYAAARHRADRQNESFSCAKLFWWFNQGAPVDWSVTPKPHYGSDGSKEFGIHGTPDELPVRLEQELGKFPFHAFWGPRAGIDSSDWIARAAAATMQWHRPTLTLAYLPHLDYDLQRYGPHSPGVPDRLRELDRCTAIAIEAARAIGARVIIVSEYGLSTVRRAVPINRSLRQAGWLKVRPGPFGEMLDTFTSEAFAVCDHQVAHVYVAQPSLVAPVADHLRQVPGVSDVLDRHGQREFQLHHPRSGELVALAEPDSWFAYPYWLNDELAPDFARTVDIHRKPGYDPCELLVDPSIRLPIVRVGMRLMQKRLGFRYRMNLIPLDASLVQGSHGLPPADPADGPLIISDRTDAAPPKDLAGLKEWLLALMGLGNR